MRRMLSRDDQWRRRKTESVLEGIDSMDADLLREFLEGERLSPGAEMVYAFAVQGFERACRKPFMEIEKGDLKEWLRWSEEESEHSATTVYINATRLRRLLEYKLRREGVGNKEAEHQTEEWFDQIPLSQIHKESKKNNKLRDKLVTPVEFEALMRVAKHPRVRTLLAVMYESACRVGELITLRIRDVEFHDKYVQIRVSGKTGERTIPLVKSIPYLKSWLQVHPDPGPDSFLFARVWKGKIGPLSTNSIDSQFHYMRKRAGIKRRIHPHMFRHSRLTELAKQGLGEYQMKSFAGWVSGSQMANVYIKLAGRSHLDPILEMAGVELETEREEIEPVLKTLTCPRCGAENEADGQFCNMCGFILDTRFAIERAELTEKIDRDTINYLVREIQSLKRILDKHNLLEEAERPIPPKQK